MTWLCVGDSITEKNFRTALNYHDYVAEELGFDVINEGLSGTGFLQDFEGNVSYLKRQKKYSPSPDIITIMGSLNDLFFLDDPRAQIEMSLRRAMAEYIEKTIEYYPLSFIALLSPPPRSYINGPCWYVDALEETARHYSLPFLNIYSGTALRPWIEENNREYFSCPACPEGDGTHPNEKGHLIMAKRISAFLREYI